ncbi:MAG: hypothetical protein ACR2PT_09620 [Endozoicomonas sp.]
MASKNKNDCLRLHYLQSHLRLFLPLLLVLAFSAQAVKKLPDKKQISEDMLSSGRSYVFYITVTPIVRAGSAFSRFLGLLSFHFYPVTTGQVTTPLAGDAHLKTVTMPDPAMDIQHQASPNWPAVTMNLFDPDNHEQATEGNGVTLPAELPQPQPAHASFTGSILVPYRGNQDSLWVPPLSTTWNLPALLAHPEAAEQMDEDDTQAVFQGMQYLGAVQNTGSQEIFPTVHVFSNMAVAPDYRLQRIFRGAVTSSNIWRLARNNPGLVLLLVCVTPGRQYGGFVLIINNLLIHGLRRELFHQIRSWDRKPGGGSPPAPGAGGLFLQSITSLIEGSSTKEKTGQS